jgi:hypothetical protein
LENYISILGSEAAIIITKSMWKLCASMGLLQIIVKNCISKIHNNETIIHDYLDMFFCNLILEEKGFLTCNKIQENKTG